MRVGPRHFFSVLAASLLVGCGEQANVEGAVRQGLRDGKSAEFRGFVISADKKVACIAVNAKNAFGGYAGWQYIELKNESGWSIAKEKQDPNLCSAQYFQLKDEALRLSDQVLAFDEVDENLRKQILRARGSISDPDTLQSIVDVLRRYVQAEKDVQAAKRK